MFDHPKIGARPLWKDSNPLVYQKAVRKMIVECDLSSSGTVPAWVKCLPEHHPRMECINGVSQQVHRTIQIELQNNEHSLIPQFPDFTYPLYVMKWIELFTMECPVWDIGLVTMCKSIKEIHNEMTPSSPPECYRCMCPLSSKLKIWSDKKGLSNFFKHCGVPPCRHQVFLDPKTLIDHVHVKSKTCVFHFEIGRVIKVMYENVN